MKNKLYVVGIGPGDYEDMSIRAVKTLQKSDVIVGYNVYIDLIKEHFADKEFFSSPMKQEVLRAKEAIKLARQGKIVSFISSGDSGVYAMASLVLSLDYDGVEIEIISGITAALSGAAILGSPLGHDFAVISLSDLLTDRNIILNRLALAAKGDFAICLYNPSSTKRQELYLKACDCLLENKHGEIICAAVKNIGRSAQQMQIMKLSDLKHFPADMFTTIFIGSSKTKIINGKMVTPRGYEID